MISNWKREFPSRGAQIFETKAPDEEAARREKALYEKIGRLEIEVDFCKRASEQIEITKSSKKSFPEIRYQICLENYRRLHLLTEVIKDTRKFLE